MNDGGIIGGFFGLLLIVAVIAFCGGLVGYGLAERDCEKAAIEADAAEWTIDAKTGVTEFRYKPCGERSQ